MSDHTHCPCGCEHPQPFEQDGKMYCGRCWFKGDSLCEMVPCAPPICDEDVTHDIKVPE